MHPKFADWYRPVTFGHNKETFELRWQGVEAALEGIEFLEVLELVRLAFGRPTVSIEDVDAFRQHFKTIDPTFLTSGNDYEVQVLAGCALAILCIEDGYGSEVPLAILTASACGTRTPKVEIDLIGMASARLNPPAGRGGLWFLCRN
jgi:hypothetical protein